MREFESGQREALDVFRQRENLKDAAEHFGMQQRLQFAFRLG